MHQQRRDIASSPPKPAKGGSHKVFYKSYYYKVRIDGRKKYIVTKSEGVVPIKTVKEWVAKNKKAKRS